MKNFRTYQLAVDFYRSIMKTSFPRHLRDQVSRSSSSIALNLAEGSTRRSTPDRLKYYNIAMGSLRETQTVIKLVAHDEKLAAKADLLGAHLYKLVKSMEP